MHAMHMQLLRPPHWTEWDLLQTGGAWPPKSKKWGASVPLPPCLCHRFERCLLHLQEHEIFRLASILDPRFKLRWCTEAEKKWLLCQKVSELNSNGEVVQVEQKDEVLEPQCKWKRLKCSQLFQFISTTPEVPSTDCACWKWRKKLFWFSTSTN